MRLDVGPIADIQPFGSDWLALAQDGSLNVLNLGTGETQKLTTIDQPIADGLELSPNRRFCAAFERLGSSGVVVDFQSGKETMRLYRGDYWTSHCQFSVAFFESRGKTFLVHATDWNRLDISDPETGELLSIRQSPKWGEPNYLDYFHCGLTVSPNGEWIADNGWIWHPLGSVRSWRLNAWLGENVWESENGASLRTLCDRAYLWDGPVCWIDDATLAVWGLGEAFNVAEESRPGVRLFDVASGKEINSFSGVDVAPEMSAQGSRTGWMTFHSLLFAVSPLHGTSAWEIESGRQLFDDPAFIPIRYHRGTQEFLSLAADGEFTSSILVT